MWKIILVCLPENSCLCFEYSVQIVSNSTALQSLAEDGDFYCTLFHAFHSIKNAYPCFQERMQCKEMSWATDTNMASFQFFIHR